MHGGEVAGREMAREQRELAHGGNTCHVGTRRVKLKAVPPRARICIVSSGCLSTGPRVEKEADALSQAGYDVRVLGCQLLPEQAQWDAAIAAEKRWSYEAIDWHTLR